MASSSVQISANDLGFFVKFLEEEGLEDFEFTLEGDENELVNIYFCFHCARVLYTVCLLLRLL